MLKSMRDYPQYFFNKIYFHQGALYGNFFDYFRYDFFQSAARFAKKIILLRVNHVINTSIAIMIFSINPLRQSGRRQAISWTKVGLLCLDPEELT